MKDYQKSIENAFYTDGYKLGMNVAVSENDKTVLFDSISEMYSAIDSFNESLADFAVRQKQRIDCGKGCEWCCHQPVFALDYELEFLIDFIKLNFNKLLISEIRNRARNKNDKLSKLKDSGLLNSKFPCPLLQNGSCMAYEARPMACRIYLSYNVKTCMSFFNNPGKETSIPALLQLPLRAGQMMNEGFKAALKTIGKNSNEFRIEEKLADI